MAKQEEVNSIGNLNEYCAPLVIWLRLIGIPIMIRSDTSQPFRLLIILYGVLMFLTTVGNSLIIVHWVIQQLQASPNIAIPEDYTTSTFQWNYIMEVFNQIFITVGAQLGLLVSSLKFCPALLELFMKIKRHNFLTIGVYRKIRKTSKIGLTILLLVKIIVKTCYILRLIYLFFPI